MRTDLTQDLPDSPGVYLFYGVSDELLYVGKSKTIRTRVRSHFASREEGPMCRRVRRVEARQTAGELGALLLELQLIKSLRPMYNIRSRQTRRIVVARLVKTAGSYSTIALEAISNINPSHMAPFMAIFKTKTQAKEYLASIVRTHGLCSRLLGLERTNRHCFSFHLGQCKGACMGEEDPAAYNARFEAAFADRRIKAWPFEGGVIIEERGENNNQGEVFIVDHWCLVYSFKYSLDRFELNVRGVHHFDYDSYKTLCGYILDDAHRLHIRTITRKDMDLFIRDRSSVRPARIADLLAKTTVAV